MADVPPREEFYTHEEEYLLTIRAHQVLRYVTPNELTETLQEVVEDLPLELVDYAFERHGRYRQLHAHAVVIPTAPFLYRGHTSRRGLRIHWLKVTNPTAFRRIRRYVRKSVRDKYVQEEINLANYYAHHYGF